MILLWNKKINTTNLRCVASKIALLYYIQLRYTLSTNFLSLKGIPNEKEAEGDRHRNTSIFYTFTVPALQGGGPPSTPVLIRNSSTLAQYLGPAHTSAACPLGQRSSHVGLLRIVPLVI